MSTTDTLILSILLLLLNCFVNDVRKPVLIGDNKILFRLSVFKCAGNSKASCESCLLEIPSVRVRVWVRVSGYSTVLYQ